MLTKEQVELNKYLNSYRIIKSEIKAEKLIIQSYQDDIIQNRSNPYSIDSGKVSSKMISNPIQSMIETLDNLIKSHENKIIVLNQKIKNIEGMIDGISEDHIKAVFKFRYIAGLSWNDISIEMGYNTNSGYIFRLQKNGLDEILKKYKK